MYVLLRVADPTRLAVQSLDGPHANAIEPVATGETLDALLDTDVVVKLIHAETVAFNRARSAWRPAPAAFIDGAFNCAAFDVKPFGQPEDMAQPDAPVIVTASDDDKDDDDDPDSTALEVVVVHEPNS